MYTIELKTIESCFRHWIKNKKGNCDFFILTFFSRLRLFNFEFFFLLPIASYEVRNVRYKITIVGYNVQF